MILGPGDEYYKLDQMIGYQFYEDWVHDFDGPYEAAEEWIAELPDETRAVLVRDIEKLFATTPDAATRVRMFRTQRAFRQDDDSFDVWLRAVQQRATEALAGIHHPLEDTFETLHPMAQRERLQPDS